MRGLVTPVLDRRELLRSLARWSALGALLGGSGMLLARTLADDAPERACPSRGCSGCGSLASCRLPAAESARGRPQTREAEDG